MYMDNGGEFPHRRTQRSFQRLQCHYATEHGKLPILAFQCSPILISNYKSNITNKYLTSLWHRKSSSAGFMFVLYLNISQYVFLQQKMLKWARQWASNCFQWSSHHLAWHQPPTGVWMRSWMGEWEADAKCFGVPWGCWKVLCWCSSITI